MLLRKDSKQVTFTSFSHIFKPLLVLLLFPTWKKRCFVFKKKSYFVIHCGTSYLTTELQLQKEKRKTSPVTVLYALPTIFQSLLLALVIRAAQHLMGCVDNNTNSCLLVPELYFYAAFFAPLQECLIKCPMWYTTFL